MGMTDEISNAPNQVKAELDRLELVERVPALQPAAISIHHGERGNMILDLPDHPAVIAYAEQLKAREWPEVDLRTARRLLKDASADYEKRVLWRCPPHYDFKDGGAFISLAAILEARAAAMHWHRVVINLETAAATKRHNAAALSARKVYTDDGVRVRFERERVRP